MYAVTLPGFGTCPFGAGEQRDPTDTTRGIVDPETLLGKTFIGTAADGSHRVYRIVKNASGSTLSYGYVVKWSATVGRERKDVTIATDDTDAPAGVVCDTYTAGVRNGYYFRMTVFAEKHKVKLGTTSNSRCTLTVNQPIVANDDNGMVWGQNSSASNNAVQNRVGFSLVATTNGVENGEYIDACISLLRI